MDADPGRFPAAIHILNYFWPCGWAVPAFFYYVAVKDENPTRTLFCASWSPMFLTSLLRVASGTLSISCIWSEQWQFLVHLLCLQVLCSVYHSHIEEVLSQSQSAMVHSQVQWVCRISGSPSGRQLLSGTSSCDLPFSTTLCLYVSDPYSLNGDSRFKNIYWMGIRIRSFCWMRGGSWGQA